MCKLEKHAGRDGTQGVNAICSTTEPAFVVSGLQWEGGISCVRDAEASEEGTFVQGLEAIPSHVQGLGLVRSSVPHKCVM